MSLPNLPSSITQKTGIQLIENGYSRLEDHISNRYWTSNLQIKEADTNTLVVYDATTGAVVSGNTITSATDAGVSKVGIRQVAQSLPQLP